MIRWAPRRTAWFLATGAPGVALAPWALGPDTVSVGFALGFATFLLGHTVGLHRGVLHRSFAAPRPVRDALVWLFVLIGLGGPLAWIRVHDQRDHWQNQPTAPPWFRYDHGAARDLWWNLHTVYDDGRTWLRDEDRADPWLGWLQRTWVWHNVAGFVVLFAVGGWRHLVVGGLLRVWLSLVLHWWVGYEAHARGSVAYPITGAVECGRNRPILGILSLGEGFHNNHHAFPDSARIGHRPGELDAGWLVIRALERMGLARDVRVPGRGATRRGESSESSECLEDHEPTDR
ncbi:MAG: fatty acid desaturase [Myxococcota bacterium]